MSTVNVTITLKGWDDLQKAFSEMEPKYARAALRKGIREGTKIVQRAAVAKVPVDTGALRRAIKVRGGSGQKRGDIRMVVLCGGKTLFAGKNYYGGMVEYGTARQQAQPFIRLAFDEQVQQVGDMIVDTAWKAIVERWGKQASGVK